jgi:hypothetical protein
MTTFLPSLQPHKMSESLRIILLTPPLSPEKTTYTSLPGASNPAVSQKAWVNGYHEIRRQNLRAVVDPSLEELDSLFGGEDPLNSLLFDRVAYPLNETNESLQSEGDSVRVFNTHISHPVQLAFDSILVLRSEVGPLGPTNYRQTIDVSWGYGASNVLCGELKRHGIIDPARWTGQRGLDHNRTWLAKELRG